MGLAPTLDPIVLRQDNIKSYEFWSAGTEGVGAINSALTVKST
jgi:hypothetical protein